MIGTEEGQSTKLLTDPLGGKDPISGEPIWLEQTYDFGTKIVFSQFNIWTVAIAGQSSFGDIQVSDIIAQYLPSRFSNRQGQEDDLNKIVDILTQIRQCEFRNFNLDEALWPITTLLFFSSDPEGRSVKAWRVFFCGGGKPDISTILAGPSVFLEGSYENLFTLLYGHCYSAVKEIAAALEIEEDGIYKAYRENYISPIQKLNVAVMPIQDAMDFAVFLAKVQIQMERFLPGTAKCGGPIDIAVVQGLPKHGVLWYPGKELRHPGLLAVK